MSKTLLIRTLSIVLMVAGLLSAPSCKKEKQIVHVSSIEVAPATAELTEGESTTLTATVLPENADDKVYYWSSSDNQVASVSESGEVFAVKPGKAVIKARARDNDIEGSCTVTVIKKIIAVASVSLDKETLELTEGGSYSFTATVLPEDADDKSLTWDSSDKEVATVDKNGVVTAVKPGKSTITATSVFDSKKKASCELTVVEKLIPVESITLDKESFSLTVGQNYTLSATVLPDNASDKSLTWESSDTDVAVVTAGKVVGAGVGTAVITAKSVSDPDITASCTVKVESDVVAVTGITLEPAAATVEVNKTLALTASVVPDNATNPKIRWEVSPAGIVSVDAGGIITGIKTGTATVTATTQDGGFFKTCAVTVIDNPITAITFEGHSSSAIKVEYGTERVMQVKITPADASNKKVKWLNGQGIRLKSFGTDSEGNPNATISFDKSLTGLYNIIAESVVTPDKLITQQFIIWCNPIKITVPSVLVTKDESYQLVPVFAPVYTSEKEVTYESSDTDIVTVTDEGLVTGKAAGTATITVKSTSAPSVKGTCEVKVVEVSTVKINGGDPVTYTAGHLSDALGETTVTSIEIEGIMEEDDIVAFNTKCRTSATTVDISKVSFRSTGKKYKIDNYSSDYTIVEGELPPAVLGYFTQMTSVSLPPVSALGTYSLARTSALTSVDIPPTVTRIYGSAFSYSGIKTISLPPSVKVIDGGAFSNSYLAGVIDLRYVESIGSEAFNCKNITKVIFGAALRTYSYNCFNEACKNLTAFEFVEDNDRFKAVNGWLFSKDGKTLYQVPKLSAGATGDVVIPDGVQTIKGGIFWGFGVTSVSLPEGLMYFPEMYAFGAYEGTSLVLPSTMKSIHSLAFNYSNSLKEVTCKAVTPPTVVGTYAASMFGTSAPIEHVYVPAESVEAYKTAAGWSTWASYISAITE